MGTRTTGNNKFQIFNTIISHNHEIMKQINQGK